jgi:hypothetical protein
MTFARGSLEILIVVGTLYYAVSRYKNFVESIELAVAQMKRIVGSLFERRAPQPAAVRGTWNPGPGMALSGRSLLPGADSGVFGILVWYVVLSHAAMLVVLMWLLLSHRP